MIMTTVIFWVGVASLLLVAIVGVLWPLLRRNQKSMPSVGEANLVAYQQQLRDLIAQSRQGEISKEHYQQSRAIIAYGVQEDVFNETEAQIHSMQRTPPWLASIIIIFIISVTIGGYFYWGNYFAWRQWRLVQQNAQMAQQILQTIGGPTQLAKQFRVSLNEHPHDAKAWYLLGKLYLDLHDYPNAVDALMRANTLQQTNDQVKLSLAYALFLQHQRRLTPKAKTLVRAILVKDTNNIDAINLLATDAFNRQQYQQAIHYWEQLLPLLSAGSREQTQILQAIAAAEKKLIH